MRAFWWFKKNSIAGMGRPGFNAVHWFDLPFDEAVLLGWLGQHSSGTHGLESFRKHLQTYAPRIFKFYGLDEVSGAKALEVFNENEGVLRIFDKLAKNTKSFADFDIQENELKFSLCESRLQEEIRFLKSQGIDNVISLTEQHHQKDILQNDFKVHHFSIEDLGAPKLEQVSQLANVIQTALSKNETLAVHCLAGIGRTSTMLMASHIVLGESPAELEQLLKKQNPTFTLVGPQGEFLRSLSNRKPL